GTILCLVRLERSLQLRISWVLAGVLLTLSLACSHPAASGGQASGKETTMADGLKFTDDQVGTGAEALAGKTVSVHYTGWLTDGNNFDSSKDRGQPFSFPLGAVRVIKRLDERVAGMKVGVNRTLAIPT